jgi:hypothetical protein
MIADIVSMVPSFPFVREILTVLFSRGYEEEDSFDDDDW